jgi:hypothetical protein
MTWLFDPEKAAHRAGWIDVFGWESAYQEHMLRPLLESIAPVTGFPCPPFFNAERVEWRYREWDGCYKVGRISRDDANKFSTDMWRIFDRVLVPNDLRKKVYVLGYGANAAKRTGKPIKGLDWMTWDPDVISSTDFYRGIDTLVHKTGGSRESSSRVLMECYAHGVVPVVERDFAFPELVEHNETGFMGSNSDEMSFFASVLAHVPELHRHMAEAGRDHLEHLANPEKCWQAWEQVLQ